MEPEVKNEALMQDVAVDAQKDEEAADGGDGMVEVDRITEDTDLSVSSGNEYRVGVNTDPSATGSYADHVNRETGEKESLSDSSGTYISSYSATAAEKKAWLNKKYTPKPAILKSRKDPAPKLEDMVTVGSGQVAKTVMGTPEKPGELHKLVPYTLFIDGVASQDDIRQGNLGDCYFLAALFQVIHYDPKFLPSIMTLHGDEVYTELYHEEYDEATKSKKWVRKPIAVKWGTNTRGKVDAQGNANLSHFGAHYRVNYNPEDEVKWEASFNSDVLKFTRTEYYQAAMWVQCLERAYADYSKLYGQLGRGNANSKQYDRYTAINGGSGWYGLRMLYGNDVASDAQLHDNSVPVETETSGLLDATSGMVQSLVTLAQMQDGSEADQMHMTTWAYYKEICPRVQFYADRLYKDVSAKAAEKEGQEKTDLEKAASDLKSILDSVKLYATLKTASGGTEGTKTDEQKAVAKSMDEKERSLQANAAFIGLGLKDFISLKASLGTLISTNGGGWTDGISDNMYIYTCHEYNIREIHFKDKENKDIDVDTLFVYYVDGVADPNYDPNAKVVAEKEDPAPEASKIEPEKKKKNLWQKIFGSKKEKSNIQEAKKPEAAKKVPVVELKLDYQKLKELVDVDNSYVVIQNPHAQTKAVYPGQTEAQSAVGTWTTSLRELFAGTTGYTAVIIKNGNHENTGTQDIKAVDGIGGAQKVEKAAE